MKPLQGMNIAHIYVNGMIRLISTNGLSNTHTNRSRKVEILTEFRMRFMLLNSVQSLDQVGNRWSSSAANLFITPSLSHKLKDFVIGSVLVMFWLVLAITIRMRCSGLEFWEVTYVRGSLART